MPYKYSFLDSHADETPKSGIVTSPGLFGKSTNPPVQKKNYTVGPEFEEKKSKKSSKSKSSKKKGMY
jgi:hypothetical protein